MITALQMCRTISRGNYGTETPMRRLEQAQARPQPFSWISAGGTLAGKIRAENEDAILNVPSSGLWAVADGLGGHRDGHHASSTVVKMLSGAQSAERLSVFVDRVEDRLLDANSQLYQSGPGERRSLSGSTVVALLALDRFCVVLWAGDSRLYRYRGGRLEQMSRDHSDVRMLQEAGVIAQETGAPVASSNIITRAVGVAPILHLECSLWSIEAGDRCLLCSDGLHKEVSEQNIGKRLALDDPSAACDSLLECALNGAAADNISAVVVRFMGQAVEPRHA